RAQIGAGEGTRAVERVPDCKHGENSREDGQGIHAETKRDPEKKRQDEVWKRERGVRASAEDQMADDDEKGEKSGAFDPSRASDRAEPCQGRGRERERERREHEDAEHVGGPPEMPELRCGLRANEREQQGSGRRPDDPADRDGHGGQREDIAQAREAEGGASPFAQEVRASERLDRVGDPEGDAKEQAAVVEENVRGRVRAESREEKRRPVRDPRPKKNGEIEARRRPERGEDALERQPLSELRSEDVGDSEAERSKRERRDR